MEEFYYKPYRKSSENYLVFTADGRLVTDCLVTKKVAQVLTAALNNFIIISEEGDEDSLPPSQVALMFLSDVDNLAIINRISNG